MNIEHFSIAERFRGPPRSGNGGYVCGRVARHWAGPATVRLKAPPPLETGLRLEYSESRAQLLDRVWGDHVFIEERTVDVHIKRLREALGPAGALVETVRGAGYRLTAQLPTASPACSGG